jgi:cystathionine beta-lyase/cystathionine gamma-synthase
VTEYSRRFGALETNVVHAGRPTPNIEGAVVTPIFQSANYLMGEESAYGEVRYGRLSNSPNHHVLHARLAVLENTEAALVTSSGMSAIISTLLAFVHSGQHVIAHNSLYGGMQSWFDHDGPKLGIICTRIDAKTVENWEQALRPETKVVYVESITNPLMEVLDLEAIVAFARRHGLTSIIDNTFTSPVNFRPSDIGFDVSVHSATKYLNGHSDVTAGVVAGARALVAPIERTRRLLGTVLDPLPAYALGRGLKTLPLRIARHNANAHEVARFLAADPRISHVYYPGLPAHPDHRIASGQMKGFGGMVCFDLDGRLDRAEQVFNRFMLIARAASLGGVESLASMPVYTSQWGYTDQQLREAGISKGMIRLSVGLEDPEDIIADLDQALGP